MADEVKLYTKKPVTIEALQYDGTNGDAVNEFMGGTLLMHPLLGTPIISTLEGDHAVSVGDFVIKGIKGEFYPCKPDIFVLSYDPA